MIDESNSPEPRKRQFTIRGILFATTLFAVAAAGFGGLARSNAGETATPFVLFVIAAPLALMLVLSLVSAVERLVVEHRKRRQEKSDVS